MSNNALILAAGTGKRMGELGKLLPKCLIKLQNSEKCSLELNLDMLFNIGIDNVLVVIGYKSELVSNFISEYNKIHKTCIATIYNPYYNEYGCEYSVSSNYLIYHSMLTKEDSLVILEADNIIDQSYLESLYSNGRHSFRVLVRSNDFIDDTKSVVLGSSLEDPLRADRFFYDSDHKSVLNKVDKRIYYIIGESMQTWYLSGYALLEFINNCGQYLSKVKDSSDFYKLESGLYNLNIIANKYSVEPVPVKGDHWVNLNTEDDIILGGRCEWIK